MANIRPVSDLQRRCGELTELAKKTKEPIYLTKRGSKHLVLIDADEYDRIEALARMAEAQGKGGEN